MIAAGLTVAALLAAPLTSRPLVPETPPIVVNVAIAAALSPSLVTRILDEATAIWRAAGFTLLWQHGAASVVPYARVTETGPYVPTTLRVVIGNQAGVSREESTPLGWITFDGSGSPEPEIYLSHANARSLLVRSTPHGGVERMPPVEQETLLGRALGRALAHELGHYLLASKAHTPGGLMGARRTTTELFWNDRARFALAGDQRAAVAQRLAPPMVMGRVEPAEATPRDQL